MIESTHAEAGGLTDSLEVRSSEFEVPISNLEPRTSNGHPSPLTVVLWFWQDARPAERYTVERVNVAARMITRNLKMPHRIVCITDHPRERWSDFDAGVEPIEIWNDLRDLRRPGWLGPTCYVRLKAFSSEMVNILGPRFVSIDIDLLVLRPLDPLFDRPEDFVIFRRKIVTPRDAENFYQGSMWMMTAGAREYIWTDFQGLPSIEKASRYLGSDQAWMRHRLPPDEAGWTDQDGVHGFMRLYRNPRYTQKPPSDARIIFFYDKVKPWHIEKTGPSNQRQRCHQCGAVLKPRQHAGAYAWVREVYDRYAKGEAVA